MKEREKASDWSRLRSSRFPTLPNLADVFIFAICPLRRRPTIRFPCLPTLFGYRISARDRPASPIQTRICFADIQRWRTTYTCLRIIPSFLSSLLLLVSILDGSKIFARTFLPSIIVSFRSSGNVVSHLGRLSFLSVRLNSCLCLLDEGRRGLGYLSGYTRGAVSRWRH